VAIVPEDRWQTSLLTGEFRSSDTEKQYRERNRAEDDRYAWLSIIITALVFAAFFFADFKSVNDPQIFFFLTALRGSILIFGIAAATFIRRGMSFVARDLLIALFVISVFAASTVVMVSLERQPLVIAPSALLLIFGVFLFVPNRFSLKFLSTALGGASFLAASQMIGTSSSRDEIVLAVIIVASIVVGSFTSSRLKRFQRIDFVNFIRVSELNNSLTQANKELALEISDRKAIEEKLRIAKEQAEANGIAKVKFIAAVSHDLRQPLQATTLLLATLENFIATGGDEIQERSLKTVHSIENSVNGLNELLNTLLDSSKLEVGTVEKNISTFSLQNLLTDIEDSFRAVSIKSGVKMRIQSCSGYTTSSYVLLKRAIDNLIANAFRYTQAGRILIGCRQSGQNIRIEIWDTGIGIAEKNLDRMFEEFNQLQRPDEQNTKGFGLGLAIVKRTAELLDHPLEVRSTLGKGSVFTITVPRADKETQNQKLPN